MQTAGKHAKSVQHPGEFSIRYAYSLICSPGTENVHGVPGDDSIVLDTHNKVLLRPRCLSYFYREAVRLSP